MTKREPKRLPLGQKLMVVFGPPGTGKTTRLLQLLETELEHGTSPEAIAFVTFTRAARQEAKDRVVAKFRLTSTSLPWFRTIHSTAYRVLQIRPGQVMNRDHWQEFAGRWGYDLSNVSRRSDNSDSFEPPRATEDDKMRFVIEWGRARCLELKRAVEKCPVRAPVRPTMQLVERLQEFKARKDVLDFTDMLEQSLELGVGPDVDVAFIDEAQDLSPLQVAVAEQWFRDCKRVYVAGDDDQACYTWCGADPEWLIKLRGQCTASEILGRSYRVPPKIHAVAERIIRENRNRVPKRYEAHGEGGEVSELDEHEALAAIEQADGSVFVLARHHRFVIRWAKKLLDTAIPFVAEGSWNVNPLSPKKREALAAAVRLRRGKAIAGDSLVALLDFVPSRGSYLLPFGVKSRAKDLKRQQFAVTRRELEEEWLLGRYLDLLDAQGAAHGLVKLKDDERRYLQRLLDTHGELPRPRVSVTTIHASKGREADLVVVVPDISKAADAEYWSGPAGREAETRVAYVAVTRARKRLILVRPTTRRFFPYPRGQA